MAEALHSGLRLELRAKDYERAPVVARPLDGFRHRQVGGVDVVPCDAHAGAGRCAVRLLRRPDRGIDVVDVPVVRIRVELRAREMLDAVRNVEAQFAEHLPAMIADQLRGIEGAAEETPAI